MKARSEVHSQRLAGFSLIELLIVIVIILVIAAIAIPNLIRSRMAANEASAVASLRVIATANAAYESQFRQGYAPDLTSLAPPSGGGAPTPSGADLIDVVLASGEKQGYKIAYTGIDADGNNQFEAFTVNANPAVPGRTGEKYFFVDQTNVIRFSITGPADATSTPVPPR